MMDKAKKLKEPYVSCIKIKGVPILPPLITSGKRKELVKYKEQAIQIENNLKNRKEIEKINEIMKLPPKPNISTLTCPENSTHSSPILKSEILNYVPYKNLSNRTRHLSLDIVDVTECNGNGFTVLDQNKQDNTKDQPVNVEETENIYECDDTTTVDQDNSVCDSLKPRLIRSNSYTIENPSPILLAHLEKNTNEVSSETSFLSSRNWSSVDSGFKPLQKENVSEQSFYGTPLSNISDSTTIDNILSDRKSPTIEVVQTDVIVQQITVHADPNGDLFDNISPIKYSNKTITNEIATATNDDAESQLLQLLKDIPENYSKQILELVQKQKTEQQRRLENYESIKKQLLNESPAPNGLVKSIPMNNLSFIASTQLKVNDAEQLKPEPSNLYTLSCSTGTVQFPNGSSIKLIDIEDEQSEFYDYSPEERKSVCDSPRIANVSRELFPKLDVLEERKRREEWASSIIGAHVKGYLTRRLLKTDKVKSLIDTIQDTLMCALQLHKAETIDEYDIELHRRLIQQVSAACYAFHDLFFALSIREQMMIISADRQYKMEKAKRPLSSSSSTRSSKTPSSGRRSSVGRKLSSTRPYSGSKA